ncbi:aminotransferase class V-fold PLP-dependent enzyme [Gryllotalpicola protaetiae]|uniref:Aminotransferase class V-fold PLP-dependent enzyme n=1 Tax=Gryllotalpicola protaetiae TaxID=2419771 RepID=A0A387BMK1_9MICO|nr:aminotransferase class V-fold PLP-dependent enzyme [Gryllotalpicola protaetiae]AYG02246.1 aminotransferase class V-fold PLP-dependent enzyme [Gryllotalpicola protaetiae]
MIDSLRDEFPATSGYLAACTMGLAPASTRRAISADLELWAAGRATMDGYGAAVERGRSAFARLVHVDAGRVAIGSQVSAQASVIAASAPDHAEVLSVRGDFSSVLAPFAQQAHREVRVREVPLEALADAVTDDTWLIAFSLVQSASGRIVDVDAVLEAAARHGARTLVDLTQSAGWLDFDASRADATVCHTYKWLCAPRGASMMTLSPSFHAQLRPVQAGWYAGADVFGSCYGADITLADDARRFDVSPAWQAWVGAAESLELFAGLDLPAVRAHNVGLAKELCAALGLPAADSAIVTWADPDGCDVRAMADAGLAVSGRAGNARVAFHVWNDERDVARIADAVRVRAFA